MSTIPYHESVHNLCSFSRNSSQCCPQPLGAADLVEVWYRWWFPHPERKRDYPASGAGILNRDLNQTEEENHKLGFHRFV